MLDRDLLDALGDHKVQKTTNEVLYHYTSISSLKSIIEGKQFWVTRSDYLNDPDEIIYFADLVGRTIDALISTGTMSEQFLNALRGNYITYFQSAFPQNYYILSLSRNRDSLAMWNYYGKNDGYCIGIDFKKFTELIHFNRFSFVHGSVIYNSDQQIAILDSELDFAYQYWISKYNGDETQIHNITSTLFARWSMYSLFFKNSGYHHEDEYRVVLTHKADLKVNFRTAYGVFTPYTVLPVTRIGLEGEQLDADEKFPLKSVTISPYIKHNRALSGLSEWLKSRGHPMDEPDHLILGSTIAIRF